MDEMTDVKPSDPSNEDPAPPVDDNSRSEQSDDDTTPQVYDPEFAKIAFRVFAVAALVFVVLTVLMWRWVGSYPTAVRSNQQWVDGSFADRASFTVAMIGLGVGTALLFVAALLAALEVRARMVALADLKKPVVVLDEPPQNRDIAQILPVKDVIVPVTDALTKARGTAVVAITGAAVVIAALFQAGAITDGPAQTSPADGAQVTEAPTLAPDDPPPGG